MTASPTQYTRDTTGWYCHTDQGVCLDGPYSTESEVRQAGNAVAAELRASMRRENYSERDIAARVRALRIGYGRKSHPHGRFEAV